MASGDVINRYSFLVKAAEEYPVDMAVDQERLCARLSELTEHEAQTVYQLILHHQRLYPQASGKSSAFPYEMESVLGGVRFRMSRFPRKLIRILKAYTDSIDSVQD
jgi:hypothetical protein